MNSSLSAIVLALMFVMLCAPSVHAGRTAKSKEMYKRGVEHNKKGEYAEAIRWYTEALKLKPESPSLYFVRGRAYRQMNRLDESIKDLSKAISLKPGYDEAYNNRGIAYVGKKRLKEAESDFRKACGHGLNDGCLNLKKLLEEKK